jgi:hypothetical protein
MQHAEIFVLDKSLDLAIIAPVVNGLKGPTKPRLTPFQVIASQNFSQTTGGLNNES